MPVTADLASGSGFDNGLRSRRYAGYDFVLFGRDLRKYTILKYGDSKVDGIRQRP